VAVGKIEINNGVAVCVGSGFPVALNQRKHSAEAEFMHFAVNHL
jgi:predicted RecA/RadA family phage recombinase